jgi:hypothetical protein
MQSISSLITSLTKDFPDYTFSPADEFRWSPHDQTIFFDLHSTDCAALLHEVSHAILKHSTYTRDIELLELERQAWQYAAKHMTSAYGIDITDDQIEDSLDTYRDWLHARSACPTCSATGLQVSKDTYKCIACMGQWRVNDARICELRRYKIHPN